MTPINPFKENVVAFTFLRNATGFIACALAIKILWHLIQLGSSSINICIINKFLISSSQEYARRLRKATYIQQYSRIATLSTIKKLGVTLLIAIAFGLIRSHYYTKYKAVRLFN